MLNFIERAYELDNETLVSELIEVIDLEKNRMNDGSFTLQADGADVAIKIRMGLDLNKPNKYSYLPIEPATIVDGNCETFRMNQTQAGWFQLEMTTSGTGTLEFEMNVEWGGLK